MNRILIAEDDPRIVSFLEKGLQAAGFATSHVRDGRSALESMRAGDHDLVVLDIGLPLMDGFEVLSTARGSGITTPVVVLTARDSVDDTVLGLESGANDYLAKPFHFAELLARVRVRLGEGGDPTGGGEGGASGSAPALHHGDLSLDLLTRIASVDGRPVELTSREFAMLKVFLKHPGQVLSREQILAHAWGYDFDPASNVVDVYVRTLRRKIGADRLVTVRGAGYKLS
ncbi:response regulator transcription factor [Dietzia aerolata]|uniref:Response regulator transcription factor n=1 Tax=Dietzia aerolata TaxID=595984 RepID=A0ABV5JV80_9ACTN|nr:response regulator transcription factor [Dietzia aerolata]MBB0967881.1 response regulator transcription factor [Dietzia aerolata]